jgi:glycosyltransferase involved in cell wall biosynthesis
MKILMTCHDTQIDRRIISQAQELIHLGHEVCIMALSENTNTYLEKISQNLRIFRIGFKDLLIRNFFLAKFVDFKPKHQKKVLKYFRGLCLLSAYFWRLFSKQKFQENLIKAYLPFTHAFYQLGKNFEYDLIQCHDFPTLEAASFLAQVRNVSLIYDAHEFYSSQHHFSPLRQKVYQNKEYALIQKCDLVFTVNQSIAKEMAKVFNISQPVTLINALDLPKDFDRHQKYNLIREQLGISKNKKILLFQGVLSINRQLESLVAALGKVNNPDIVLVVMGNGDIEDELKKIAKDNGTLNQRIFFMDAVPQHKLLMYSASADMGIIPYPHIDLNSYYCTPNKLFEFIQANLPIIANDSPELRRFVEVQGFGITCLMDSIPAIAHAIDQAFSQIETSHWQENLNQKANQFSWQGVKDIYLNAMMPFLKEMKDDNICAV